MADDAQRQTRSDAWRLLPWTSDDGKPCYLTSTGGKGLVSKMADVMEAEQIRTSREILAQSRLVLAEAHLGKIELRFVANRLMECLADTLRITESRGGRLGIDDPRPDDDVEELTEEAGE